MGEGGMLALLVLVALAFCSHTCGPQVCVCPLSGFGAVCMLC